MRTLARHISRLAAVAAGLLAAAGAVAAGLVAAAGVYTERHHVPGQP